MGVGSGDGVGIGVGASVTIGADVSAAIACNPLFVEQPIKDNRKTNVVNNTNPLFINLHLYSFLCVHLYRCTQRITYFYNQVKKNALVWVQRGFMNLQIEKRIGNNLRKIRESRKMTQNEASAKLQLAGCDITRSALAKIEVGQRHLYPDEIILFKQIYSVSYDEIFE